MKATDTSLGIEVGSVYVKDYDLYIEVGNIRMTLIYADGVKGDPMVLFFSHAPICLAEEKKIAVTIPWKEGK